MCMRLHFLRASLKAQRVSHAEYDTVDLDRWYVTVVCHHCSKRGCACLRDLTYQKAASVAVFANLESKMYQVIVLYLISCPRSRQDVGDFRFFLHLSARFDDAFAKSIGHIAGLTLILCTAYRSL